MLSREIEEARAFTRARKDEGSDELFAKWHKLSSGRRGLERFVLDKQSRQDEIREVKASRSVVFNLQCLFLRSSGGSKLTDQQVEMIRQQYGQLTSSAQALAQIYGAKDEAAVMPYYNDQEQDDDSEGEIDDLLLDDGVMSVGSNSVSSRRSKSAKKVKKRSEKDGSSSSRKKKGSSKKSSPRRFRSKSPMRRLTGLDSLESQVL